VKPRPLNRNIALLGLGPVRGIPLGRVSCACRIPLGCINALVEIGKTLFRCVPWLKRSAPPAPRLALLQRSGEGKEVRCVAKPQLYLFVH
jgi:hypothetical protein